MTNTTLVWDLPTRLFHWALVAAVTYAWISVEILEDMQQHFYAGYSVLTLLLFRLIWGLVGSTYSQFKRLWFPISETLSYAKQFFSRAQDPIPHELNKGDQYLGHSPLGSLSVIAILAVLLLQTSLGLFSTDDYVFGPLAGLVSDEMRTRLTELHHDNVNFIYAIISLHILAIDYYQIRKKINLTRAMITGKKNGEPSKLDQIRSPWLALLLFAVCVAAVFWLTTAFIDQLPQDDYYY